jgi:hypothetical protein
MPYCIAILKGIFTLSSGEDFTASMSARETGEDCKKAQANTIIAINLTLKNFIDTYPEQIVQQTYTIQYINDMTCPSIPRELNKAVISYDFEIDTQVLETGVNTNVYDVYLQIRKGKVTIMEASILNIILSNIDYRPFGVPITYADFGITFSPNSFNGSVSYDNTSDPVLIDLFIKPDIYPFGSITALRSGIILLNNFLDNVWNNRVNLDNDIEFGKVGNFDLVSPSCNKFMISFNNPFIGFGYGYTSVYETINKLKELYPNQPVSIINTGQKSTIKFRAVG